VLFQYLGTAAAEGIPAIFCACDLCAHARRVGGYNVRTRSGAIVDGVLKIDLPPDTYHHLLTYGLDLTDVEHMLITHPHEDHYAYAELAYRARGYGQLRPGAKPLTVYGGKEAGELFMKRVAEEDDWQDVLAFHRLKPYVAVRIGEYTVTPLPARHAPEFECFIYLIEREGKNLLYAHDTGQLFEEVYDALEGQKIDFVSLDLTYMNLDTRRQPGNGHMGLPAAKIVRERLLKNGAATDKTIFAVNHFSHNGGLTHEQLKKEAVGFLVSYDGLEIVI